MYARDQCCQFSHSDHVHNIPSLRFHFIIIDMLLLAVANILLDEGDGATLQMHYITPVIIVPTPPPQ